MVERTESGGYVVFAALDADGPEPAPGQFYMLAAERGWGAGDGRPYLSRAFSVADARPGAGGVRLSFLAESVGPGTERLVALERGEGLWIVGPLGRPFSAPGELTNGVDGAILVGGGIGIAPLALLRRRLTATGVPARTLLGFRDEQHAGGLELFASERAAQARSIDVGRSAKPDLCSEIRLASEDGHAGHKGYVTDLLAVLLEGDDPSGATVYACGPPAMLEAVREMCLDRGVEAELAMEAPMACGFGACFGCAVELAGGGFMRLCVDGPVVGAREVTTALVAGVGH